MSLVYCGLVCAEDSCLAMRSDSVLREVCSAATQELLGELETFFTF